MDQKTYLKKFMLWTGVLLAVLMILINLFTFKVVEATPIEEIAKRFVVCLAILAGYELFAAFLFGPLSYHLWYERRKE